MTRDEAIALASERYGGPDSAARYIDLWASLGMLKLEEPRSAYQRAKDVLTHRVGEVEANDIMREIYSENLRIIDLITF